VVCVVGPLARLSILKVSEQAEGSSNDPPAYKGRITLNPILLNHVLLCTQLEIGGFKLTNSWVHQNLVWHHMAGALCETAVLLKEAMCMVGRPYRPADLGEVSLGDLQWLEMARAEEPVQMEDEVEHGSYGDPDQADISEEATSD
jgi:hypothetical protein